MNGILSFAALSVVIVTVMKSLAYAKWSMKNKNRKGAAVLFLLSAAAIVIFLMNGLNLYI